MTSPWVQHVQAYQRRHNVTYAQAMRGASATWKKATYRSGSSGTNVEFKRFKDYVAGLSQSEAFEASKPNGKIEDMLINMRESLRKEHAKQNYTIALLDSDVINVMPGDKTMEQAKISEKQEAKLLQWQKGKRDEVLVITERKLADHDRDTKFVSRTPKVMIMTFKDHATLQKAINDEELTQKARTNRSFIVPNMNHLDETVDKELGKLFK